MNVNIPDVLTHIANQIIAAGVSRNVSIDPTTLRLPGVLVQFTSLDLDTLVGYSLQARVLVVAPDRHDPRALATLSELISEVLDADLEVTGPITPVGVTLPTQPGQAMPGLAIPIQVHVTPDQEEV